MTGEVDSLTETAYMAGCAAGLRKAADICEDQIRLYPTLRNAASRAQAQDIQVISHASAGRVERGEYENSTSSVETFDYLGSEIKGDTDGL